MAFSAGSQFSQDPKQAAEKLTQILYRFVTGHDRGTLWVACRQSQDNGVGFSPCGMQFKRFS
jgi:hypothetical protein